MERGINTIPLAFGELIIFALKSFVSSSNVNPFSCIIIILRKLFRPNKKTIQVKIFTFSIIRSFRPIYQDANKS